MAERLKQETNENAPLPHPISVAMLAYFAHLCVLLDMTSEQLYFVPTAALPTLISALTAPLLVGFTTILIFRVYPCFDYIGR